MSSQALMNAASRLIWMLEVERAAIASVINISITHSLVLAASCLALPGKVVKPPGPDQVKSTCTYPTDRGEFPYTTQS